MSATAPPERMDPILLHELPGMVTRYLHRDDAPPVWLTVSRGARDVTGLEPEAILADPGIFRRHVHPDDRAELRAAIQEATRSDRRLDLVFRFNRPDGRMAWLHSVARSTPRPDGGTLFTTVTYDVSRWVLARNRLRERAEASESRLRAWANRLLEVREEERTVLSRELHDQVGQALTGLQLEVAGLRMTLEPDQEAIRRFERMDGQIRDTIAMVQRLSSGLRPPELDQLGLVPCIRAEAQLLRDRTELDVDVQVQESGRCCTGAAPDAGLALLRVLQEALSNVVRHADARRVEVRMRCGSDRCTLEVVDDGRGIPQDALRSSRSLGLLGMRERMLAMGGTLHVGPGRNGGTRVRAEVPRDLDA